MKNAKFKSNSKSWVSSQPVISIFYVRTGVFTTRKNFTIGPILTQVEPSKKNIEEKLTFKTVFSGAKPKSRAWERKSSAYLLELRF